MNKRHKSLAHSSSVRSSSGRSRPALLEGLESRWLFAFGKTDVTFGVNGRAEPSIPNPTQNQQPKDVLVLSNGKIIQSGDAGVVRLNADGTRDDPFGTLGAVRLSGFSFKAEAVDSSNNLFLVGRAVTGTLVIKITAGGLFDNTFGTRGTALVSKGDPFRATSIAVQADGKVIIGGTVIDPKTGNGSARIYRLNADGSGDNTFGTGAAADFHL